MWMTIHHLSRCDDAIAFGTNDVRFLPAMTKTLDLVFRRNQFIVLSEVVGFPVAVNGDEVAHDIYRGKNGLLVLNVGRRTKK
jgi:hypothetical protein